MSNFDEINALNGLLRRRTSEVATARSLEELQRENDRLASELAAMVEEEFPVGDLETSGAEEKAGTPSGYGDTGVTLHSVSDKDEYSSSYDSEISDDEKSVGIGKALSNGDSGDGEYKDESAVFEEGVLLIPSEEVGTGVWSPLYEFDSLDDARVTVTGQYTISQADLIVFALRNPLSRCLSIPASNVSDKWSRLYAMMVYVLNYRDADAPVLAAGVDGFHPDGDDFLELSRMRDSWSDLLKIHQGDSRRIRMLFEATTKFSPTYGTESSKSQMVMDLVRKEAPRYWLAWKIVSQVAKHEDKVKSRADVVPVSLYELLVNGQFGLQRPVDYFTPTDEKSLVGLKTTMIRTVFRRLHAWDMQANAGAHLPSLFSPLSSTLLEYFSDVEFSSDISPGTSGYGSFKDKGAMYSFILAVSELIVLESAGAWMRMLLRSSHDDAMLARLRDVSLQILGYDVHDALRNPLSALSNEIISSRVSISNMGSLAAVWLATYKALTPRELLTAGSGHASPFIGYAKVIPFIPTVLRISARRNGADSSTSISIEDVVGAFDSIMHSAFSSKPGQSDVGASDSLSNIDDAICETLLYSVMNDSFLSNGHAASWLATALISGDD